LSTLNQERSRAYWHVLAPQLLAKNRSLNAVHPIKLKNALRRIHANSANMSTGGPLSEIYNDLILAHRCRRGPSTATGRMWLCPAPAQIGWILSAMRNRSLPFIVKRHLSCRFFFPPTRGGELAESVGEPPGGPASAITVNYLLDDFGREAVAAIADLVHKPRADAGRLEHVQQVERR
jgi:hypothetical protein